MCTADFTADAIEEKCQNIHA